MNDLEKAIWELFHRYGARDVTVEQARDVCGNISEMIRGGKSATEFMKSEEGEED